MYISKVVNTPSFGMNFVNKGNWNERFLKSFENSQLVKDIDKKYPEAVVKYIKVAEDDMADSDTNFRSTLFIKLAKDKICKYFIDSHTSRGADNAMSQLINTKTLADVEKDAAKTVDYSITSYSDISIKPKKSNPVIDMLRRIFG